MTSLMCVPVIDVSRSGDDVDFAQLRDRGIIGVVARATNGCRPDDRFLGRAQGCARANLPLGTSALFHPDADGTVQALILWDRVTQAGGSAFEVVECATWWDTTWSSTPMTARSPQDYEGQLARFVAEVTRLSGRRPVLSTSAPFWDRYVQSSAFAHLDCVAISPGISEVPPYEGAVGPRVSWAVEPSQNAVGTTSCCAAWRFPADGTALGHLLAVEGHDVDLTLVRAEAWKRWVGRGPWVKRADERAVMFVRPDGPR